MPGFFNHCMWETGNFFSPSAERRAEAMSRDRAPINNVDPLFAGD
jgi:hypothetical protein